MSGKRIGGPSRNLSPPRPEWPSAWGLVSTIDLPWHPKRVYAGTSVGQTITEVDHRGRRYRAAYWTKGNEPGNHAVWTDIGAAKCDITPGETNTAPTVTLQSTATVAEGASLSISATGSDVDGDTLTYSWDTGEVAATGTSTGTITFTAPEVTADKDVVMTVTVSDGTDTASARRQP